MTIEEKFRKLEEIVKKIEYEEVDLEESLRLYQEGINLIKELKETLESAKLKIDEVLKESNIIEEKPLTEDELK